MNSFSGSKQPSLTTNAQKGKGDNPLIVSVTSGKGGVGKTLTTVNLAIAARKMGKSVLIFDADLGLANVDVVMGLTARYNIKDVLEETIPLKDIIVNGPLGIRVIPSGSGIRMLAQLSPIQRLQISDQLESLDEKFDVIFLDTGAGISDNVLHFNACADRVLVVTTPEPHAMTDAYALIKVMTEEYKDKSFFLLVNQARSADEGLKVFGRIADVAKRFLGVTVEFAGHVPMDLQVQRNVMLRRAAPETASMSIAGQAWNEIALKFFSEWCTPAARDHKGVWRHLFVPVRPFETATVQARV